MCRRLIAASGVLAAAMLVAAPASAQVVQSLQVGVGGFFPRGIDARVDGDVLVADLFAGDEALLFDMGDFKGWTVNGEWNVSFGNHVEVGAGVGYYQETVNSEARAVFGVFQKLRLRTVPVTGLVRFLPIGTAHQVQPYVGGGVVLLNWRYSEVGDFVDPTTCTPDACDFFSARYSATGFDPGAMVVYGLRLPIGGDIYGLTLEGRYQWAQGDINDPGFLGDKIDLSGGSFNVGFLIRF